MKIDYIEKDGKLYPTLYVKDENVEPENYGKYSRMRERYLKEYEPAKYDQMLMFGKLSGHLAEVQEETQNRVNEEVKKLKKVYKDEMADQNEDPVRWAAQVNNLIAMAEEMVLPETVYA